MKVFSFIFTVLCVFIMFSSSNAHISPQDLNPIYIHTGSVQDEGWAKAIEEGRIRTDQMFPGVSSVVVEAVPEDAEFMMVVEKLIKERNSRLVIACSDGYSELVAQMAAIHPEVFFVQLGGNQKQNNLSSAYARMYQLRYLTGIIAGHISKSGQIGYVGSYRVPQIIRGLNAFALGVRKVNPEARVYVAWLHDWSNFGMEQTHAMRLSSLGCDVMSIHTDTTAVAQWCERNKVPFIGYHVNMLQFAPHMFVTAPMWNWSEVLPRFYQQVLDDNFVAEVYFPDLSSGAIGMAPMGPGAPPALADLFKEEYDRLHWRDDVFLGPIRNNQGIVKIPEGRHASDEELWSMDWLVEGVEEAN